MTSLHDSKARQIAECLSIAPFGDPVVPDVNMRWQRSSPSTPADRAARSVS